MDVVFIYYDSFLHESVFLVEHLHQICPVDIIANVTGNVHFPGSVNSAGRHCGGEAFRLRLRPCIMKNVRFSYFEFLSLIYICFSDLRLGNRRVTKSLDNSNTDTTYRVCVAK